MSGSDIVIDIKTESEDECVQDIKIEVEDECVQDANQEKMIEMAATIEKLQKRVANQKKMIEMAATIEKLQKIVDNFEEKKKKQKKRKELKESKAKQMGELKDRETTYRRYVKYRFHHPGPTSNQSYRKWKANGGRDLRPFNIPPASTPASIPTPAPPPAPPQFNFSCFYALNVLASLGFNLPNR